jgi:phage shock protein C
MYCTRCGLELEDKARFCSRCGSPAGSTVNWGAAPKYHELSRPIFGKKIAGVCAGFARYFDVDVTLVRILWLVLIFWPIPIGLIGYVIAWIVMPRDPLPVAATPHTASGRA